MNQKTKSSTLQRSWWAWAVSLAMVAGAALHAQTGGVDPDFKPVGTSGAFALQPDGRILASGTFNSGAGFRYLARLNPDGSLDSTFTSPGPDQPASPLSITHLLPLPGGRVLVGGDFGQFDGQQRIRLARLLPTGALDLDWNPGDVLKRSTIGALALQPEGSMLIGVDNIGGVTASDGLIRLRPDGTRDTNFQADGAVNGAVFAIQVLPNGDFYIGGRFTAVNNIPRAGIARLKADGSVDPSFAPGSGANGDVNAISVQLDGRVLIAGEFDQVAGAARSGLARLYPEGGLDPSFDAGEAGGVKSLAVGADGKIILAGFFYYIQGVRRVGMARLLPDGKLDWDFATGEGYFRQVTIQPDGLILAGTGGGSTPGLFRFLSEPGDFPGRFEILPETLTVTEGTGPAQLRVKRSGGSKGAASVSYGASLFGQIIASGTLTFADGQTEQGLAISVTDDQLVRVGLSISVLLVSPSFGAEIGYYQWSEIHVLENDTGFSIEAGGAIDEDAGVVSAVVSRQGAGLSPMQVDFTTMDGTAKAGQDYVARSGTLHFGAGETGQAISIAVLDNPVVQGARTFSIALKNPSNGAVLINDGIAQVMVLDVVSQVAFSGYGSYFTNEAAGRALIPVLRNGRTGNVVTVRFQTTEGTGRAGTDYQPVEGTLTFAAGETVQTFSVPLLDNTQPQTSRTVQMHLSSPTGGAVFDFGPDAAARNLTILDDDGPGDLDFRFNVDLGGASQGVGRLALTPAQQILAAGSGIGLRRLNTDGAVDPTFQPEPGVAPTSLLVANDNRTWVSAWQNPMRILATNGAVVWTSPWPAEVLTLALQADQRVLAGLLQGVDRVLPDGRSDPSFADRGARGLLVEAIAVQPDGRILCGGSSAIPGNGSYLVRLNADGALDESFNASAATLEDATPGLQPAATALLLQPDGRILVGGRFDRVGGSRMRNLARLNSDGSVDSTWDVGTGFDNSVQQLAQQGDGRILAVGTFKTVQGVQRHGLARLEPDGVLDTTFAPDVPDVFNLVLQGDGHLLVGGGFFRANGLARSGLVRLRGNPEAAAGIVAFAPAPSNITESSGTANLVVTRLGGARGRIVVPYAVSGGTAMAGQDIAVTAGRVEFADGDSSPKSIAVQVLEDGLPDGDKTVELSLGMPIGGAVRGEACTVELSIQDADCRVEFATTQARVLESDPIVSLKVMRLGNLRGPAAVGYSTRASSAVPGTGYVFNAGVVRFADGQSEATLSVGLLNDAWGQPDLDFWVDLDTPSSGCRLGQNQSVQIIVADDDRPGTPLIFFSSLPAWAPTPQFDWTLFAEVSDLAMDGNQRVLALLRGIRDPLENGLPGPSSVVRFNPDGSFDPSFWPGGGPTEATLPLTEGLVLVSRSDGTVLVGTTTRLVQVNASGQAESGAFGGVIGSVHSLLAFGDGSVLVGGALQLDRPEPWCHLVRRKADGTPDPSFRTVVATLSGDPRSANVLAVTPDSQGRFLVGGSFDVIQDETRWGLARLSASGEIDRSFDVRVYGPTPGNGEGWGTVRRIVIQPDGRVLIAGKFNRVEGVERPNIARLMPDGSVDSTFVPALPFGWMDSGGQESIEDLLVQPDGRIVIAGIRLVSSDGNGSVQTEGRIARLNPDGSLDPLFDANGSIATLLGQYQLGAINRMLVEPDGSLLIGGRFNRLNGIPCPGLARINGGLALGFSRVQQIAPDRLVVSINTPLPTVLELQGSTDLRSWTTILTDAVPAGPREWELTLPPGISAEFFRLSTKP